MKVKRTTVAVATFLLFMAINLVPVQACELWGLTPGFWKQEHHFEYWPAIDPYTARLGDHFAPGVLEEYTVTDDFLVDALRYRGGPGVEGAARILLRAAVAALLNAHTFGKIDYEAEQDGYNYSPDEVIDLVNEALASLDRANMLSLAAELDFYNNMGYNEDDAFSQTETEETETEETETEETETEETGQTETEETETEETARAQAPPLSTATMRAIPFHKLNKPNSFLY